MSDYLDQLIELSAAEAERAAGAPLAWLVANHALPAFVVAETAAAVHPPRWTIGEDQFLRENLGWLPEAELAARLGRSVNAIHLRWERDLGLPSPSKHPAWLTAHEAAALLGVDGHAIVRLIDLGRLPARLLPGGRRIRLIRCDALKRWAVNPLNWIYLRGSIENTARISDPDLRRLIERQQERWGDTWWSPGQAAAYHGVAHNDINRYLRAGKLHGVKWGNWWLRRSEATQVGLVFVKGRGAAQGFHAWGEAGEGDAFLILARAVGLSWEAIGILMDGRRGTQIAHRLRTLRRQGQIPRLIEQYSLQVEYDPASGDLFADWRVYRHRFPYLARAVAQFLRGDPRPDQVHAVRQVLALWVGRYAANDEQRRLAFNLRHANKAAEVYVRQAYETLRGWGIDPLAERSP